MLHATVRGITLFAFLIAILALPASPSRAASAAAICTSSGVPALATDQEDYHPAIPVVFLASGLVCEAPYTIFITRPDGTTESLSLVADATGSGTTTTAFDGQEGGYVAQLRDASATTVASTTYHGSHFRYGHLTWRPVGFRTAEFTLTNAFRRGYCALNKPGCQAVVVGDLFRETIGGTQLFFGDGGSTGTLIYETLAFDAAENWVIGRAVVSTTNRSNITRTYATNGPFTAQINSCCRISGLRNANSKYLVQTLVRFDLANASPVSSLPPIVNAPINTPGFSFLVPAVDANGDALSFRLATSAESGIGNPIGPLGGLDAPFALTVDPVTGVVSWNTNGTLLGQLYTTQIVIEERRAGTLIGRSAVDFILKIVGTIGAPPTCTLSPATTVYTVAPGQNVAFTVTGADPDPGQTVTINTGGLPPGATMTPGLPLTGSSPQSSNFSFTPTTAQQGAAFAVLFTVTDNTGRAVQCSVTINVTANRPPTADAGGPYTVAEGGSVTLIGTGTDPDAGDVLTFAWDLDNNGTFETSGQNPTFSAAGIDGPATRTVTLKVCDNKGACATSSATITITNAAPTIGAVSNNGPIDEATSATITVTASDPAGAADPLSYEFDCDGDGIFGPAQTSSSTTCFFDDNGTYQVNVRVTDDDGGVSTASTQVVVNNVAPTANAGPDQSEFWGIPVTFNGSATDPSAADTLAGFTFGWTFGDGGSASTALASNTYTTPGSYIATLSATDKDGGTGTDTAAITITKRPSALSCANVSGLFGFGATLSATLSDPISAATAILGGNTISFAVGSGTVTGTTNASGVATAASPLLAPGTYSITATFAGNDLYTGSSATCTLTIGNSVGKVTWGNMRSANNGRGGGNANSDGTSVTGEVQFQNDAISLHAHTVTALGISADRTKAWIAATGTAGEAVLIYVEDNGEPGRDDRFKISVNGTAQNGDGAITGGNVQIHK